MSDIWTDLAGALRRSAEYEALRASLGRASGLPLPAAAWVSELLAEDLGRPLLVVVPREADALGWLEASRLFGRGALYFSTPSLTPYQETEISLLVRAQESLVLDALYNGDAARLVCTPRALFRRLPNREAFNRGILRITPGDELAIENLVRDLGDYGYERCDLVTSVGEVALRGGIVDLFPPGRETPVRLDFFGDEVDSIRAFGAEDQRSRDPLDEVRVLPLTLFPEGREDAALLADRLAGAFGRGEPAEAQGRLDALRAEGGFAGWQNYLPALPEETRGLEEALAGALTIGVDPAALVAEAELHHDRLADDYGVRRGQGLPAPPPEILERGLEQVGDLLAGIDVELGGLVDDDRGATVDFAASWTDLFHGQLPRFPREVETAAARRERLIVVARTEHRRRLEELCESYGLAQGRGGVELADGALARGFRLPPAGVVVFGEEQLFPRAAPRPSRAPRYGAFVSGLRDLRTGDFIVHTDHGIGQFVGLRTVGGETRPGADALPPVLAGEAPGAAEVEVMEVRYAGGKNLLLPLSRLDQIQKYGGIEGVAPRLDRLGGSSWTRTKERVKEGMRKIAGDLLRLYAERQVARAPAMPEDGDFQAQFEAAFEYEETPDQIEAIAAIKEDLMRERPMDRLLCGDVGFGKTEVAMRAAFKAVEGGYQVALLAPTTILADQHLETFLARLAAFPVKVEMISRIRSGREVSEIRKRLASGEIDILIGTHRLLSADVVMPRLGLLIVDEEQRFGVAQKERLKKLKRDVHVLALSATPVPRTLQLSLAGVRDLSVIETPPRDRMAVETLIAPFSEGLVREAIEEEIERGGQVFYVYNRVEGIETMAKYLRELLPDIRLTVGHGQMDERELARRMHSFKAGEYDLLLATTIIENGIDISNVNTMIVHRADRFGLAQLYQLRGRVGRSNLLAYCYLLIPSDRVLSETARKRLAAIREFTQLGAGFRVAARDLEIRGAGNLLGAEQSGHIAAVGMETYLKMLEETVRELRGEEVEEAPATAIDLPIPIHIPTEYLGDANLRMEIYRRIAAGEAPSGEILSELEDRFGPPPESVRRLVEVAELKRLAESLRVQSISARGRKLQFRLRRDTKVDIDRLIAMVSELSGASFSPGGVLTLEGVGTDELLEVGRSTLERLSA